MSAESQETLAAKKDRLVADLSVIEDEYERLAYILDLGKRLSPLEEEYRIDTFRIDGCTSNLWLFPETRDGRCYYRVDSDSAVTKGIAAILAELYSGHRPEEILAVPPEFLGEVGVPQLLSPNRRNGLANLTGRIMDYAKLAQGAGNGSHGGV